jgi:hypothetical protein
MFEIKKREPRVSLGIEKRVKTIYGHLQQHPM